MWNNETYALEKDWALAGRRERRREDQLLALFFFSFAYVARTIAAAKAS